MYQYFIPFLWMNNLITSYNSQVYSSFSCPIGQISKSSSKIEFGSSLPTKYSWHLDVALKASSLAPSWLSSLIISSILPQTRLSPPSRHTYPLLCRIPFHITTVLGFAVPWLMLLLSLPVDILFILQNLAFLSPPWRSHHPRFILCPNRN